MAESPNFLQSLIDLVRESPMGRAASSTYYSIKDPLDQDIEDISRYRMPRQASKLVEQVMGAYGSPSSGVFLPKVPQYNKFIDVVSHGDKAVRSVLDDVYSRAEPAVKAMYDDLVPTGGHDTMLGMMLKSGAFGKFGEKANAARNLVTQMGEEAAGRGGGNATKQLITGISGKRPEISKLAAFAGPNAQPTVSRYEQMYAAVADPKTGKIIHSMSRYDPGDHGGLGVIARNKYNMPDVVEGFVDPKTFDFFDRSQIEQWLQKAYK